LNFIGLNHCGTAAAQRHDDMLNAFAPECSRNFLQIFLDRAIFVSIQRQMGLHSGFLLVGGQVSHQCQQLIIKFRCGSGIQHNGDTGLLCPACDGPVDLNGNFQLQQYHVICMDDRLQPGNFFHPQGLVGTGDYDNPVLCGMFLNFQSYMPHAAVCIRTHNNVADIHTGIPQGSEKNVLEQVISDAAHHGDISAKTGALQRLIGSFAAGSQMEGLPVDGLSGFWNALRGGNDVHDKAADHKELADQIEKLVGQAIDADMKYMHDNDVIDADGNAGTAYYEDDEAFEFMVETIVANNKLTPEQAVKVAALVDDYMDYQQAYLESKGLVEWDD